MTAFGTKHTFSFTSQFVTRRFNRAGNIQIQSTNAPNELLTMSSDPLV